MTSIAITVEGVLRRVIGGAVIRPGIDLYYGLATRAKVILLTGEVDHESLEYWLRSEGMNSHVRIIWSNRVRKLEMNSGGERLDQLSEARMNGHDVQLVIEPDPAVSSRLVIAGFNVCTFTHAEYSVPSWRPDSRREPRPWDELSEQVAREAYIRATDPRNEEHEEVSRRSA